MKINKNPIIEKIEKKELRFFLNSTITKRIAVSDIKLGKVRKISLIPKLVTAFLGIVG